MPGLTYAQLLALSDADQITDERLALVMEGEKCGEDEARAIIEQHQLELWQGHKKG